MKRFDVLETRNRRAESNIKGLDRIVAFKPQATEVDQYANFPMISLRLCNTKTVMKRSDASMNCDEPRVVCCCFSRVLPGLAWIKLRFGSDGDS